MAHAEAITTDETIRALERAVVEGDVAAAEKLEAARRRLETAEETVERLLLPEVSRHLASPTALDERARAVLRGVLHVERLPRGAAARLAPVTARLHAASSAAAQERGRVAALKLAEDLRPRATRMTNEFSVAFALGRAEGTARERTLSTWELEEAIATARATGQGHAGADHAVANSYKYPVSYTSAAAYRAADGSILVEIVRHASQRPNVVILLDAVSS